VPGGEAEEEAAAALAEWLKAQRARAGMGQRELARASGVSKSTLGRMEQGIVRPTARDAATIRRLAEALHASVLEALHVAGILDLPSNEAEALDLAVQILSLNDDGRAHVRALIDELRRD
jgi:transcriptional regulator with XRE-family HTH domain